MNYEEAIAKIKDNWEKLPHETIEGINAVWMVDSDLSESYEVDYEKIGMKSDGCLVWAYASGCSCWDGDYSVHEFHEPKEIHAFTFNHKGVKEDWQKMIIDFAEKMSV